MSTLDSIKSKATKRVATILRAYAARTLGTPTHNYSDLRPLLELALKGDCPEVRRAAAQILREMA